MVDETLDLETVKVERDGGATFLMLNRPEKRNAMSPQLHIEMCRALDWAEADQRTKVVIVTGVGGHFSSGQDLRLYFRDLDDDAKARLRARRAALTWRWDRLANFAKPSIAMVEGYCFGGAMTAVIACDFAIAADTATFGLSEVNWGVIPGGLLSWAITEAMGYRDALYYALTGDTFNGVEAASARLVTFATSRDRLRDETLRLSRRLEEVDAELLRHTKQAIRTVRGMNRDQARDYLSAKYASVAKQADID